MVREPALWEELYSCPFGGDAWGDRALAIMRATVPEKATAPRRELILAYMDALCGDSLKLTPDAFLGGGLHSGKGDYQGCSRFNPVLLFARDEVDRLNQPANHDERNYKNASNRRVLIFFFQPGTRVAEDSWPCPRVKEGVAGCQRRFWSDAEVRRRPGDVERRYEVARDTFACRFYDRMAMRSPCEAAAPMVTFWVRLCDFEKRPIGDAPYRVVRGSGDRSGYARPDGSVTIQARSAPERLRIEWTTPDKEDEPYPFAREFYVDVGTGEDADDRRLYNLGYESPHREDNVRGYQADFGHPPSGQIDDIREELRAFHDGGSRPETAAASASPEATGA